MTAIERASSESASSTCRPSSCRPRCHSVSARARYAPTWRSAAPSTRSWTPNPPAWPLRAEHLGELRRVGMAIKHAVESAVRVVHPGETELARHLRDDLHRTAVLRRGAPAQRHDLRGRRGRSIAMRNRHLRGNGGARGDGTARRRTRRSSTRASSARGFAAAWPARRRWASIRRSCPRSKAKPTSPARACSSSTTPIRCGTDSGFRDTRLRRRPCCEVLAAPVASQRQTFLIAGEAPPFLMRDSRRAAVISRSPADRARSASPSVNCRAHAFVIERGTDPACLPDGQV